MKRIIGKLKCFFGSHDWLYNNEACNDCRTCRRCDRWEQYTLVDFGRSKEWVAETSGARIARENREQCNHLTKDQMSELLSEANSYINHEGTKLICCDLFRTGILLGFAEIVKDGVHLKTVRGVIPVNYCPWCGRGFGVEFEQRNQLVPDQRKELEKSSGKTEEKWHWMMEYCKRKGMSPALGWVRAEEACQKERQRVQSDRSSEKK